MEADLVNAFIEKQRDLINDIVARNLMLEAKLAVSEKKLQLVLEEQKKYEDQDNKIKILDTQNNVMKIKIENNEKNEMNNKEKIEDLHKHINKLTLEKETLRQTIEKYKKKAEDLIS